MHTILVGLNAKYVHTNLAIRLLQNNVGQGEVSLYEGTINDRAAKVAGDLIRLEADAYGFSCYIWNIEMILKVGEMVKKARPEAVIFLGGPEVSDEPWDYFMRSPFIDYIFSGEAEDTLPRFLERLGYFGDLSRGLTGVVGRGSGGYVTPRVIENLDELCPAYRREALDELSGRILYYESMRGCPLNCSYCLSSAQQGVRMLSLERVLADIDDFIDAGVRQVKFVDRTFNLDHRRTYQIIEYIIKRGGATNFHFEIAADLLAEELIALIETAPQGLLQFEAGLQSTSDKTLAAIDRKTDVSLIEKNIKRLVAAGNCHIHLDLIAGLPYEDLGTFKDSFDEALAMGPHMLQLGFLKLLRGTKIRAEAGEHHYHYTSFPPYEVIANAFISAEELLLLKDVEDLVDRYYNSGSFAYSLKFLTGKFSRPFAFYETLADFYRRQGCFDTGLARQDLYRLMGAFCEEQLPGDADTVWELLKFDYLVAGHLSLPRFFKDRRLGKEEAFEILKDNQRVATLFPKLQDVAAKKLIKQVAFQIFPANVLALVERDNFWDGEDVLCIFYQGQCEILGLADH